MLWLSSRANYQPVIEYCGGTEVAGILRRRQSLVHGIQIRLHRQSLVYGIQIRLRRQSLVYGIQIRLRRQSL